MKEKYIAPEVEILCFAPIERLAADSWGWSTWSARSGSGQIPGEGASDTTVETGETNPEDGEG